MKLPEGIKINSFEEALQYLQKKEINETKEKGERKIRKMVSSVDEVAFDDGWHNMKSIQPTENGQYHVTYVTKSNLESMLFHTSPAYYNAGKRIFYITLFDYEDGSAYLKVITNVIAWKKYDEKPCNIVNKAIKLLNKTMKRKDD